MTDSDTAAPADSPACQLWNAADSLESLADRLYECADRVRRGEVRACELYYGRIDWPGVLAALELVASTDGVDGPHDAELAKKVRKLRKVIDAVNGGAGMGALAGLLT